MSWEWMYYADRHLMEFINSVHEFINAARKHKHDSFIPNYNVWTEHGERGIMLENGDEEYESIIPDFVDDYGDIFEDTRMVVDGH